MQQHSFFRNWSPCLLQWNNNLLSCTKAQQNKSRIIWLSREKNNTMKQQSSDYHTRRNNTKQQNNQLSLTKEQHSKTIISRLPHTQEHIKSTNRWLSHTEEQRNKRTISYDHTMKQIKYQLTVTYWRTTTN